MVYLKGFLSAFFDEISGILPFDFFSSISLFPAQTPPHRRGLFSLNSFRRPSPPPSSPYLLAQAQFLTYVAISTSCLLPLVCSQAVPPPSVAHRWGCPTGCTLVASSGRGGPRMDGAAPLPELHRTLCRSQRTGARSNQNRRFNYSPPLLHHLHFGGWRIAGSPALRSWQPNSPRSRLRGGDNSTKLGSPASNFTPHPHPATRASFGVNLCNIYHDALPPQKKWTLSAS